MKYQSGPLALWDAVRYHPTRYGAWDAAVRLSAMDCPDLMPEIHEGLRAKDEFTRECCLEILLAKREPAIVEATRSVFGTSPDSIITAVPSIARLIPQTAANARIVDAEQRLRETYRSDTSAMDIIDATPNIDVPSESVRRLSAYLDTARTTPGYMADLCTEDIKELHFLFYADGTPPVNGEYRTLKLWDMGPEGSLQEPFRQPFAVPAAIPHLMEGLTHRYRASALEHPLAAAATTFYRHNLIHPFYDCNGRTNFALMNLFLDANGLHHVTMLDEDLPGYYASLNASTPDAFGESIARIAMKNLLAR